MRQARALWLWLYSSLLAIRILPDQGSNPYLTAGRRDSSSLSHREVPWDLLFYYLFYLVWLFFFNWFLLSCSCFLFNWNKFGITLAFIYCVFSYVILCCFSSGCRYFSNFCSYSSVWVVNMLALCRKHEECLPYRYQCQLRLFCVLILVALTFCFLEMICIHIFNVVAHVLILVKNNVR